MKLKLSILSILIFIQVSLHAQPNNQEVISIGTIDTIYSKVLNEDRVIYIHTPVNYKEMENIPVVFVLDAYSQFKQTVSTIDYISNGAQGNDIIPSSIVIGITNPNRDFEFTPIKGLTNPDPTSKLNTGGAPLFLEFITNELIPHLDSTYNTCDHRTLIGHSLGGLFVFHVLLEKPEYFTNYLTIDPTIGFAKGTYFETIINTLANTELRTKYLYVASADNRPKGMSFEELEQTRHIFLNNVDKTNRKLYELAETNQWSINIEKVYYPDEDHFSLPYRATYDAFKYFYDYFQFHTIYDLFYGQTTLPENDLLKLKNHYKQISEKMTCELKPQQGYLNSWAWGIGISGNKNLAKLMFLYNIELYPDSSNAYSYYGNYLNSVGESKKAIEQFEKSLELEIDENVLRLRNETIKEMKEQNK